MHSDPKINRSSTYSSTRLAGKLFSSLRDIVAEHLSSKVQEPAAKRLSLDELAVIIFCPRSSLRRERRIRSLNRGGTRASKSGAAGRFSECARKTRRGWFSGWPSCNYNCKFFTVVIRRRAPSRRGKFRRGNFPGNPAVFLRRVPDDFAGKNRVPAGTRVGGKSFSIIREVTGPFRSSPSIKIACFAPLDCPRWPR